MNKLRRKIYMTAGYNTVSMGTGRKEFHPKKPRPGLEHYIAEAGKGSVAQAADPSVVDDGVVGNFMAARFNHQGHLGALFALVHPSFAYKPSIRVEGACASGGLALVTAVKSVLSGQADVSLAIATRYAYMITALCGRALPLFWLGVACGPNRRDNAASGSHDFEVNQDSQFYSTSLSTRSGSHPPGNRLPSATG